MTPNLIPPTPLSLRTGADEHAKDTCREVAKYVIAEIVACRTHVQRIEFWTLLNEWTSQNLANVEGRVGGGATGGGATAAGSLGTTKAAKPAAGG
jgi:hypothetical protein